MRFRAIWMLPKYENGDVIVVYREQRHPLSSFYGEEAAVRLKSGERYLKTIERGNSTGVVNLKSFNAKPINGVKLEWIGEICFTLPRGQIERLRGKTGGERAQVGPQGRPDRPTGTSNCRSPRGRWTRSPDDRPICSPRAARIEDYRHYLGKIPMSETTRSGNRSSHRPLGQCNVRWLR